jgi:hypothetical protein
MQWMTNNGNHVANLYIQWFPKFRDRLCLAGTLQNSQVIDFVGADHNRPQITA